MKGHEVYFQEESWRLKPRRSAGLTRPRNFDIYIFGPHRVSQTFSVLLKQISDSPQAFINFPKAIWVTARNLSLYVALQPSFGFGMPHSAYFFNLSYRGFNFLFRCLFPKPGEQLPMIFWWFCFCQVAKGLSACLKDSLIRASAIGEAGAPFGKLFVIDMAIPIQSSKLFSR